jgi:hypothetical protein
MLYPAGRAAAIPAIALVWFALATPARAADSLQPVGWDRGIALSETPDLNPDPHIV